MKPNLVKEYRNSNGAVSKKPNEMRNTIKITTVQLIEMLLNWSFGAQPASVQYVTTPKLNKEGKAEFGEVTKIANVGIMLGYSYEKGTHYMSYKMQQTFKSFYFDSVLNFIPKSLLKPFFPQYDTAKAQGLEKAVYHRELKIENIRKLKFRKTTYVIVPA